MRRSKFPYDRDGVPSLDVRVQARGGFQIELSGTVDSGASSTPIRAQVLRPSPDGELRPWGPVFAIQPVFLEYASPLWGQADFFAVFGVMFWRNIAPPQFELSY